MADPRPVKVMQLPATDRLGKARRVASSSPSITRRSIALSNMVAGSSPRRSRGYTHVGQLWIDGDAESTAPAPPWKVRAE